MLYCKTNNFVIFYRLGIALKLVNLWDYNYENERIGMTWLLHISLVINQLHCREFFVFLRVRHSEVHSKCKRFFVWFNECKQCRCLLGLPATILTNHWINWQVSVHSLRYQMIYAVVYSFQLFQIWWLLFIILLNYS